jgi:hypothetical protein
LTRSADSDGATGAEGGSPAAQISSPWGVGHRFALGHQGEELTGQAIDRDPNRGSVPICSRRGIVDTAPYHNFVITSIDKIYRLSPDHWRILNLTVK